MKRQFLYILLTVVAILSVSSCKRNNRADHSGGHADSLVKLTKDYNIPDSLREIYTDSLYNLASERSNDSLSRYYLREAAVGYYGLNEYDKSKNASLKVYRMSVSAKDSLSMGKGLHFLGVSYYGEKELDSALHFYKNAEKVYASYSKIDSRTVGEIILYKAYIYYDVGEYVISENEAFRALKHLKIESKPSDLYNCYNLIATSLEGQDKNKDAIEFFEKELSVLDDFKKEGYTDLDIALTKASCYNNMGLGYLKLKQYPQAIEFFNQALKTDNIKTVPRLYAKLLNNLASAKYKSGNEASVPKLLNESIKVRDSLDDKLGLIASNITQGEYSLYKKDTARAIRYLRAAYTQAKAEKSNFDLLNSLRMLINIDKPNNDFYIRRYVAVNDSLQKIAENNRNKFARIEYDTDVIINEKEALAKKNSFIIGVSIVVVMFIAAIFIIYYLNSKNKELLLKQEQQKANEEIYELMFEQQGKIESAKTEEKSRIAMELHDGILNNIYALRLNLEFINKKSDDESIAKRKEYIKELQGVESEIRGVSHDLSRNALFNQEQSFENMLEFMITSQKNNFETEFEATIDEDIDWENMSNVRKVNVYRIIQEALQNINKYSSATHAKVAIHQADGNIAVKITDNGKGFDPDRAKGGIGLKNLRKRAEVLNGTLKISSKPGDGTAIDVLFPL